MTFSLEQILFMPLLPHYVKRLFNLLSKGPFELRKWSSNCPQLLERIKTEHTGIAWTAQSQDEDSMKLLGIEWNPQSDEFHFRIKDESPLILTKRSILSMLAKSYNPLGWIAPVIILGKIGLQRLWISQVGWDDKLQEDEAEVWKCYFSSLTSLSNFRIPRWIGLGLEIQSAEFHGFCDASEAAYGAVVCSKVVNSA